MKRLLSFITVCVAMLAAAAACGRHRHDASLERVYALSDSLPGEALAALDSIDASSLHGADLQFYNLLRVKTADKNDRNISADSFITGVIEHFEHSGDARLYAEALYYGGRVSDETGDYPSALRYYQDALEILPDNEANLHLRGCILAQTMGVLNALKMQNEALPYIKQSIDIDIVRRDTLNLVHDLHNYSTLLTELKRYGEADSVMKEAGTYINSLPENFKWLHEYFIAQNKYYAGDYTEALQHISNVPERLDSVYLNLAYAHAAQIYYKNEILDTAYIYARKLLTLESQTNKASAYFLLLEDNMRQFSSRDSLSSYLKAYSLLNKMRLERIESQTAQIQNSYYNYARHERAKIAAESSARKTQAWLYGVSFIALALIVIVLIVKYRNKSEMLSLHEEIEELRKIKDDIQSASTNKVASVPISSLPVNQEKDQRVVLLEQKIAELLGVMNTSKKTEVKPISLDACVTDKIRSYIKKNKHISEDASLWKEIENGVLAVSPRFSKDLWLLSDDRITDKEYHTALLIKCGISPKDMKILLCVEKGTIYSRRESLSKKIFGEKKNTIYIDNLIRLL